MSERTDQDRLEIIIQYLEGHGKALFTIDRRIDSMAAEMRGVCESLKSVATRQSELERASTERLSNCSEVMQAMLERIYALEQCMTPIPKPFDPKIFEIDNESSDLGGNGADGKVVLSVDECSNETSEHTEDGDNGSDDDGI